MYKTEDATKPKWMKVYEYFVERLVSFVFFLFVL